MTMTRDEKRRMEDYDLFFSLKFSGTPTCTARAIIARLRINRSFDAFQIIDFY